MRTNFNKFEKLFLFAIAYAWLNTIVFAVVGNLQATVLLLILSGLLTWADVEYMKSLKQQEDVVDSSQE